jgi:hypothetical protein
MLQFYYLFIPYRESFYIYKNKSKNKIIINYQTQQDMFILMLNQLSLQIQNLKSLFKLIRFQVDNAEGYCHF